jgi:hypothetical protein
MRLPKYLYIYLMYSGVWERGGGCLRVAYSTHTARRTFSSVLWYFVILVRSQNCFVIRENLIRRPQDHTRTLWVQLLQTVGEQHQPSFFKQLGNSISEASWNSWGTGSAQLIQTDREQLQSCFFKQSGHSTRSTFFFRQLENSISPDSLKVGAQLQPSLFIQLVNSFSPSSSTSQGTASVQLL